MQKWSKLLLWVKQKEYQLKSLGDIVTLGIIEIQKEGLRFWVICKEVILKMSTNLNPSTNLK